MSNRQESSFDIDSLKYPVLVFFKGLVIPERSADALTSCTAAALKKRYYDGCIVADATGRAIKIKTAHKLHGIGTFWGLNIFINRKLRVFLEIDSDPFQMSLDEVKSRVIKSLYNEIVGWDLSEDFEEIVLFIQNSRSINEISEFITEKYYHKYM